MNKKLLLFTLLSILFTSCEKRFELNGGVPDFKVSLSKNTFSVNEEVEFQFDGSAGIISFFSGEVGHDYEFRDGRVLQTEDVSMSFTLAQVMSSGTQNSQFSIFLSTDFNGSGNIADLKAANWTDITSRFTLPPGSSYTASGVANLADLVPEDKKPIFIGFKYTTRPQATFGTARQWFMQNFLINSGTSIGRITLADMSQSGFQIIDEKAGDLLCRSRIEPTRLGFFGHLYVPGNDPQSENWIVTKPIYAKQIDLGPDRPIAVKGNSEASPTQYRYVFTQPGNYVVHFIAKNANVNESKEVVRKVEISIVP